MQTIYERIPKSDWDILVFLTHENKIMVAQQGAKPHIWPPKLAQNATIQQKMNEKWL